MIQPVSSDKIRYFVDEQGRPTDVLIDYETWRAMLDALEQFEDWAIAQAYIERRQSAPSPDALGLVRLPEPLDGEDVEDGGLD